MRYKINFKTNNSILPINNQHILNGYIHRVLGTNNKYHDNSSNYNISSIQGGKFDKNSGSLTFKESAYIIVSSLDIEFINNFISGLLSNNSITDGFVLNNIELVNDIIYDGYNNFSTLSPIILKVNNKYITTDDDNFIDEFTNYLKSVVYKKFGKNLNFEIRLSNSKKKTKLIKVKNIFNKCSQFSFTINGDKRVSELFYYTGIGLSRGSGFGTIIPSHKLKNERL